MSGDMDTDKITVEGAVAYLRQLTAGQREEVFAHFCKHCGDEDPRCQCWNDE